MNGNLQATLVMFQPLKGDGVRAALHVSALPSRNSIVLRTMLASVCG